MSAFGRFWLLPIGASTHAIAADGGGLARGRIATTAWTGRGGLWAAAASVRLVRLMIAVKVPSPLVLSPPVYGPIVGRRRI